MRLETLNPRWRGALWQGALTAALVVVAARSAFPEVQTKSFRQAFPVVSGSELRLANLAGAVEVVAGQGGQVVVDATVHAEGNGAAETEQLLQGIQRWVHGRDSKGREEWALAYPVERYHSFHYPRPGSNEGSGFWSLFDVGFTSTVYRGEKVRLYNRQRSSAPTLYADLRIAVPPGTTFAVRNVVGQVHAGTLDGVLTLETGSGDIRLDAFAGRLKLSTGSGDVRVGAARGESSIDTGSGDIVIQELVGNGNVDTGSGDVVIAKVAAGKLNVDTGSGNVTVRNGVSGHLSADTGSGDVHIVKVELEELVVDTGSGEVNVVSSLAKARKVIIKTGSGDVTLSAGQDASFDINAEQGSGDLTVGYADATLRRSGHNKKVIGARRGDGRTVIHLETGSGDCTIKPHGG
jgi:hypothetical protein